MNRIDYLVQRYLDQRETEEELMELMELIASGKFQEIIENKFAEGLKARMREKNEPTAESIQQELVEVRGRFNLLGTKETTEDGILSIHSIGPWLRMAAAILLLTLFSFTVWQYGPPFWRSTNTESFTEITSVTSSGNVTKVILADGSLVWLKGTSTITYPAVFTGNSRSVSLQGEALFEVSKDPNRPFIIQCGDLTTTVLGTSFNIRSDEEEIEVVVLTGSVSLTSNDNKESIVLLTNEKVVYNGLKKQLTKVERLAKEEEKVRAIEGTEYSMAFEDTRMEDIIRRVEGKFNVSVTMSDTKLGNCLITADFTDQSLERTFSMISQALGFDYEIQGQKIKLAGTGCD